MRVLLISWEYPPHVVGGMGKHVAELVPYLGGLLVDETPLEIDVLTTRFGGGKKVEQINRYTTIYRVNTLSPNPLDLYNSVVAGNQPLIEMARELALTHQYDLIHIHDWLVGEAGIVLKHEWKCPLLTTIHATERGRYRGTVTNFNSHQIDRMEWRTCYEAWRVIVCSRYMESEINDFFGTPVDKIEVIANGVNLSSVHSCPPQVREELRLRYAPTGERLLFYVGRIVYEKGLHVLLGAMPQILDRYADTRLLVAGRNSHEMLPRAQELGVQNAVTFLDFITNEMRDYLYQTVDGAIFPSLYEPFGIVALEAMALGCNVIASDVGGLGEVVKHKQTGLTTYPNDTASIAWAVEQLFEFPNQAALRRSWASYEVHTRYNWHVIAAETVALYGDIVTVRHTTEW